MMAVVLFLLFILQPPRVIYLRIYFAVFSPPPPFVQGLTKCRFVMQMPLIKRPLLLSFFFFSTTVYELERLTKSTPFLYPSSGFLNLTPLVLINFRSAGDKRFQPSRSIRLAPQFLFRARKRGIKQARSRPTLQKLVINPGEQQTSFHLAYNPTSRRKAPLTPTPPGGSGGCWLPPGNSQIASSSTRGRALI